jgi:hypothetical protein
MTEAPEEHEAQFPEFFMDSGSSPGRILLGQAAEKCLNFGIGFRSASKCS